MKNESINYRRKAASFGASSPLSIVKTLKFPIELPSKLYYTKILKLQNTIYGCEEGSLIAFLISVLSAGFELHSNMQQANNAFANRLECFPNENVSEHFKSAWGESPKPLLPKNFLPLSKESKPKKPWTHEYISDFLFKTKSHDYQESFEEFSKQYCESLHDAFDSWDTFVESPEKRLEILDGLFEEHQIPLKYVQIYQQAKNVLNGVHFSEMGPIVFNAKRAINNHLTYEGEFSLYVLVSRLLTEVHEESTGKDIGKQCQEKIVSKGTNALSWLFNKGLHYFKTKSVEEICNSYRIPCDFKDNILTVKKMAQAVRVDKYPFRFSSFSDFRREVSSQLNSWTENYVKRLLELERILNHDNDKLEISLEEADFMKSFLFDVDEVVTHYFSLNQATKSSKNSILKLLGKKGELPSKSDVENISSLGKTVSIFMGELESLKNKLSQEIELSSGISSKSQPLLESIKNKLSLSLSFPKLNSFSCGVKEPTAELKQKVEQFNLLYKEKYKFVKSISSIMCHESIDSKTPQNRTDRELALLDKRYGQKKEHKEKAKECAKRFYLQKLISYTSKCRNDTKCLIRDKLIESKIFLSKRIPNKVIFNSLGSIYLNPFSKSKHTPYPVKEDVFNSLDVSALFEDIHHALENKTMQEQSIIAVHELVCFKHLLTTLNLESLPSQLPYKQLEIPEHLSLLPLDDRLKQLFVKPKDYLSRDAILRLLSVYESVLQGIFREYFIETPFVQCTFSHIGNLSDIFYSPKDKIWNIDRDRLHSHKTKPFISTIVESSKDGETSFSMKENLKELKKNPVLKSATHKNDLHIFLKAAPHDWVYALDLPEIVELPKNDILVKPTASGISVVNNDKLTCARIVGSNIYKNHLIEHFFGNKHRAGIMQVLLRQHYKQNITWSPNGIEIDMQPTTQSGLIHVPFQEVTSPSQEYENSFENSLISIDLGERGFGYAIFDLTPIRDKQAKSAKDVPLIKSGHVTIPEIRHLIKRVKNYRARKQGNHKFSSSFNTSLKQHRESVCGLMRHHINKLCKEHNGFPVFEANIGNLSKGEKQLSHLYEKLTQYYTYSSIPAHKNERRNYWFSKQIWQHSFIKQKGSSKPINRFPGVSIGAAGTSQTCSICKRNPYTVLKNFQDESLGGSNKKLKISHHGVIEIGQFKMVIFSKEEERKKGRRRRFCNPISNGEIKVSELKKQLRKQLRQPHQDMKCKDTTQSQYLCCFADCQDNIAHSERWQHADENAAINIGYKWLDNKVNFQE